MTTRSDHEGVSRDGGDAGDPQVGTDTQNELATAQQGDEARRGAGHGVVPPGGIVLHGIAGLNEGEGWAAELQRQLRREQGRRQELEGEVHDLEEEVQRLRRQLKDERDEANRDMDVLRERLREKTNEIDRLNDIIRDLRSELRDVKGELADVKHQHKREMAAMRDEYMGRMDAMSDKYEEKMAAMQQHLEKLDARERQRDAVVVARHVAREFLNCVAASTLQRWQQEPEPLNDHARTWRDVMKIMKDWKATDKKPIADKMWSIAQVCVFVSSSSAMNASTYPRTPFPPFSKTCAA